MRARALLACALVATALPAAAAQAHEGNPSFSSEIEGFRPVAPGVEAEVLNFDDSVRLTNRGDKVVVVEGYEGEPYLRISPDGAVEVNERSPAHYLNDDRFAEVEVPDVADPEAPPRWSLVDRTGQYAWHDHRIHYMAQGTPPQVEDEGERTEVFDYEVPLEVGGRPTSLTGTLVWVGEDGAFPVLPFIGLGTLALAAVAFVVVRRRRPGSAGNDAGEAREAW